MEQDQGEQRRKQIFDLWMIPHFLFGAVTGFAGLVLSLSEMTIWLITLVLALLWELFEKLRGIDEHPINSVLDILLSLLALFFTLFVARSFVLTREDSLVLLIAVGGVYAYCNISGWIAYRRRRKSFYS